ncbi:dihydrofolate reductase family protein [Amycolatopsis sp. CA-161197]|uniref:dihydrofolate reductase family protein n=1 Tax=Amycolatopsis sp. CA-161197 TaxID=3239922 RepID=UPI003D8FAB5E
MGRIVNATFMTLDGDSTNMADWHWDYFSEEATAAAKAQLDRSDALIMGRKTYDGFSAAWPQRAGTDPFADRMNSIDKYVVSSSLIDPQWTNSHVLGGAGGDAVAAVREVKERTDRDILQYGFGDVTRLLLANGLLDELRVWLHPVISGATKPDELLYRDTAKANFTFNGSEVFGNGMVILSYTPANAAQ